MSDQGVKRVVGVITDQMPKLNKLCDDAAAMANASVLRAAKVVSDLMQDFERLDQAVGELEALRGLPNAQAPEERLGAGDVPTDINPNGLPDLGPRLVK